MTQPFTGRAEREQAPVLVTGASGFTGGHLARRLRALGHPVRALVRPSTDVAGLRAAGLALMEGDIRNAADVRRAAKGVSRIYHVAAAFRSVGLPESHYRAVNVGGTLHVLEAAARYRIGRVIHCSTAGVHGDVKEIPCTEDSPLNPGDIYQQTKLEAELQAREAFASGLPGVIVRPAGIYGPGDLRFLKLFRAIYTRRFRMFGSGRTLWHAVYIDDLIDGFVLCDERHEALGQTYIVAGDRHYMLDEVVKLIAEAVGAPPPNGHLPYWPLAASAALCEAICRPLGIEPPLHRRRAAFFNKDCAFSIEKARCELGYVPRISLEEGLRRTATWYLHQGYLTAAEA